MSHSGVSIFSSKISNSIYNLSVNFSIAFFSRILDSIGAYMFMSKKWVTLMYTSDQNHTKAILAAIDNG